MISNQKKKLLHVAKRELGLTDEQYRAALLQHTDMTSSADPNFTDFHFKQVIDHFKLVYGFQVKSPFHQRYPRDPDALPSPEHLRKLDHVIDDFSQFEPAAKRREFQRGFNERTIKRPWPQTRKEVNKMIEAWAARLRRAESARRKLQIAECKLQNAESPSGESDILPSPLCNLQSASAASHEECPF